jgi:hypothetical protein
MDSSRPPPHFCLGIYWPDDYTDYLVHMHEPFEVFRLEVDQEGAIVFWVAPESHFETMLDEQFDAFVREAKQYLGMEELVELGTARPVELRVTSVPFPPVLMMSNRHEQFHAIVGLGDEPFTALLSADESEPLIADVAIGFPSESVSIVTELSEFAEAYYNEFYDRQDALEKMTEQQKRRERRGGEHGFSRN